MMIIGLNDNYVADISGCHCKLTIDLSKKNVHEKRR